MASGESPEAFYLPASPGRRFAIFHPPHKVSNGSILYIHPFAEEMNKSRAMASLACRALARSGFGVLQADLFGCGDSDGEFGEASWEQWMADIDVSSEWLSDRVNGPLSVLGLRLGAPLALAAFRQFGRKPDFAVFWQPVASGRLFINQFLRLAVAGAMLRPGDERAQTHELRAELAAGRLVEVGGYALSPGMYRAIEALDLTEIVSPGIPIAWMEVRSGDVTAPPATQRIIAQLRGLGACVNFHAVVGDPFWTTQEICFVPELIASTVAAFEQRFGA